jgi:glycosyltransferase involved in cell wall biosynthesis
MCDVSIDRPLVSICVPAYNAERWLADALDSAMRQTYSEFELVVADNSSTDTTGEIARSFDDPRVRVETSTRMISAVANHNRAIRLSQGVFVKFLHADDMLLPRCVEEMVSLALEDPQIALVFAPRQVLLEPGTDAEWAEKFGRPHERFARLERINEGRDLFDELLAAGFEENWIGEPSAVLLRRAPLEHVGLFNERLFQIADLELWARLAIGYRVGFIDDVLSVYRHHEQSGTAQNARMKRDWLDTMWLLEGLLEQPSLTPEEQRLLLRLRRSTLRRTLRSQAGRVVHGRWSADLASYLAYRARIITADRSRAPASVEEADGAEVVSPRKR